MDIGEVAAQSKHGARPEIINILRKSARKNGVSFAYLVDTAKRESGFNPSAKATTSSASGLFQFVNQTWLETMRKHGASLGYKHLADLIGQNAEGKYFVADNRWRKHIMALRFNPQVASDLAAAFTRNNYRFLATSLQRAPTTGELYIAHFLGRRGALRLINNAINNPELAASKLFPTAARANRSVFFAADGKALTVASLYQHLTAAIKNSKAENIAGFISNDCPVVACRDMFWPDSWSNKFKVSDTKASDTKVNDTVAKQNKFFNLLTKDAGKTAADFFAVSKSYNDGKYRLKNHNLFTVKP